MPVFATAGANHLKVDEHRRDWFAMGPFYDRVTDNCDFDFIMKTLRSRFEPDCFEKIEVGCHSKWIVFDRDDRRLVDLMRRFAQQLEEGEHLDEMAIEAAVDHLIEEEWDGACFTQRLCYLLHSGGNLGGALLDCVSGPAYNAITEYLYESDII